MSRNLDYHEYWHSLNSTFKGKCLLKCKITNLAPFFQNKSCVRLWNAHLCRSCCSTHPAAWNEIFQVKHHKVCTWDTRLYKMHIPCGAVWTLHWESCWDIWLDLKYWDTRTLPAHPVYNYVVLCFWPLGSVGCPRMVFHGNSTFL